MKIGQYPSSASLISHDLMKYRKHFGESLYDEINKAVGLSAHGVGIEAFVYLRRIIENQIIIPAHERAKNDSCWDDVKYRKADIKEKMELLKELLPDFLVNNDSRKRKRKKEGRNV